MAGPGRTTKGSSGKYKLIVCDKFDYSDATVGVFDTLEEAMKARAGEEGESNSLIEHLIYDDQVYLVKDSSLSDQAAVCP